MNVKELIEKLSALPGDTKVVVEGIHGYSYHFDSSAVVLNKGYFVVDEGCDHEGSFVAEDLALLPCEDGKPLLDLASPHISPGVKLAFTRYPKRSKK